MLEGCATVKQFYEFWYVESNENVVTHLYCHYISFLKLFFVKILQKSIKKRLFFLFFPLFECLICFTMILFYFNFLSILILNIFLYDHNEQTFYEVTVTKNINEKS